jgi:hypothetical protein
MYTVTDEDGHPDPDKKFFCDLRREGKWRQMSGTNGNIGKHIQKSHLQSYNPQPVLSGPMSKPELTDKNLLGLLIEQDSPFMFADSLRLHRLFSRKGDRRTLRIYAEQMARDVRDQIRPRIKCCREFVLVFDERSDGRGMPYLGLKVEDKTADALGAVASKILVEYEINERVKYVVSDTPSVMPATARSMKKIWCPCWAHVLSLILGKLVEAVKAECLDDLLSVVGGLSRGSRWWKFLARYGEFMSTSIPSFSSTRSYSLARLVARALKLWEPLQDDIRQILKKDAFDEAMLHNMEDLAQILGTFAIATAWLESDDFGTISWIYDWLFLIQQRCSPIAERWPAIGGGLSEASVHSPKYVGKN